MKNLSLMKKMGFLVGIVTISLIIISLFSVISLQGISKKAQAEMETKIRSDYDAAIKEQVDSVISLIQAVYNQYEAGTYTLEEAKTLSADLVRELRYGENGYFWIDTYEGDNVVLLGNSTEGTNRYNTKDADGFLMIQAIIAAGQKDGGGFTNYMFPKEGETESSPKRSYSKSFEPFKWVIGTGNYTDFIDDDVAAREKNLADYELAKLMTTILIVVIFLILVTSFSILIIQNINQPIKLLVSFVGTIAKGDFSKSIPDKEQNRKDEFGTLSRSVEDMRQQIQILIGAVKTGAENIQNVVNDINHNVFQLNGDIEEVSATTEELAAGMEETAASTEEINAMSYEIQAATKNIASKAEEGSLQASQIHERAETIRQKSIESKEQTVKVQEEINISLTNALKEAEIISEIEELAESIMSITSQTNLLALNASIEAARAGEAGKGFAVVAEEIRNLAEQSRSTVIHIQEVTKGVTEAVGKLTSDSSRLLNFVSTDMAASYDLLGNMADSYNNDASFVNTLVTDFSATSEELLASIEGVLQAINEISTASSEGATGTSNITEKITQISMKSNNVTEKTETAEKISNSLAADVGKFIV